MKIAEPVSIAVPGEDERDRKMAKKLPTVAWNRGKRSLDRLLAFLRNWRTAFPLKKR